MLLGKVNVDGTPAKPRQANAYSLFVKEKFAEVKAGCEAGTPHKETMACT